MQSLVACVVVCGLTATGGLIGYAAAQQGPDQFKDLDERHWAYQSVENLRAKNIMIGTPDGYFRGKKTLTRYEFAVALDRLLKNVPSPLTQEEVRSLIMAADKPIEEQNATLKAQIDELKKKIVELERRK
jgi:hypothetical protein